MSAKLGGMGLVVVAVVAALIVTGYVGLPGDRPSQTEEAVQTQARNNPCAQEPTPIERCREFLRMLADDAVFPRELACFIALRAGLKAPACAEAAGDPEGGDALQPGSSPGKQPRPGRPGRPGKRGDRGPDGSQGPPGSPPESPGNSGICITNPLLPICLDLNL